MEEPKGVRKRYLFHDIFAALVLLLIHIVQLYNHE
jgi:hypothetical protein